MASSGFSSGDGLAPATRDLEATRPSPPKAGLMEQVLRATLELTAEPTGPDWAALQEVARRHRGVELCADPVAREMVAAVLQLHYTDTPEVATRIPAMSRQLAITLLDDPPSRGRMMRLWSRLQESLP